MRISQLIIVAVGLLVTLSASAAWYATYKGVTGETLVLDHAVVVDSGFLRHHASSNGQHANSPGSLSITTPPGTHSKMLKRWQLDKKIIPEMILSNRERGKAYLEYRLYNVMVTNYSIDRDGNSSKSNQVYMETISLTYEGIRFDNATQ